MSETINRNEKAAQKAALIARLKVVLADARGEADRASEAHLTQYPRLPKEHHEFGGAVLLVRKPRPAFREALKTLEATDRWASVSSWKVDAGYRTPKGIGGTRELQEVAQRAAAEVMKAAFPDDDFWVHTWVD
jgi:hypothetical protein